MLQPHQFTLLFRHKLRRQFLRAGYIPLIPIEKKMPDTNAILSLSKILDTKVTFPTRTLRNLVRTFLKQLVDDLESEEFESTEDLDKLEVALRDYVIESELEDIDFPELGKLAEDPMTEADDKEDDDIEEEDDVPVPMSPEVEVEVELEIEVEDTEEEDFNKYLEETEEQNDESSGG